MELRGGQSGERHQRRRVAVMTSPDFEQWSCPQTCSVFRHGDLFLMFYTAMKGDVTRANEVRLATSRDGVNWARFHTRKPTRPTDGRATGTRGKSSPRPDPPQGCRLFVVGNTGIRVVDALQEHLILIVDDG